MLRLEDVAELAEKTSSIVGAIFECESAWVCACVRECVCVRERERERERGSECAFV